MNNMLRAILRELVNVEDSVLGIILDFLKKLNTDKTGEFLTQFKKFLRGEMVEKIVSYIVAHFIVTVDETVFVEDAVKAGKFDWSEPKITSEKFPKLANGQKSDKEITLFHFNKTMFSSKAVIAEMDRVGYRPANIWELIGLAIKEPIIQRKFSIAALGSVCELDGYRRVPCLCEGRSGRILLLLYFDYDWDDHYRFIAVRK